MEENQQMHKEQAIKCSKLEGEVWEVWRRLIGLFDSTLVASSELKIHCLGTVIRKPQHSQFDKQHRKSTQKTANGKGCVTRLIRLSCHPAKHDSLNSMPVGYHVDVEV
jgi:hypothetical protein